MSARLRRRLRELSDRPHLDGLHLAHAFAAASGRPPAHSAGLAATARHAAAAHASTHPATAASGRPAAHPATAPPAFFATAARPGQLGGLDAEPDCRARAGLHAVGLRLRDGKRHAELVHKNALSPARGDVEANRPGVGELEAPLVVLGGAEHFDAG